MGYPSDLTDSEWELIKDLIPVGSNAKVDRRSLINGVFYVVKTGCQWRQLPSEFPKWTTTYSFFRRNKAIWEKIMDNLTIKYKENSFDITDEIIIAIDSQSVKTNSRFEKKGYDGYKKVKGLKRSIAVDKRGNILAIDITNANEHDTKIGVRVISNAKKNMILI